MVRSYRAPIVVGMVLAFLVCFAPQVLATDISDIGFVDQSALGQLQPFVAAQQQFAQYQSGLAAQFKATSKARRPRSSSRSTKTSTIRRRTNSAKSSARCSVAHKPQSRR